MIAACVAGDDAPLTQPPAERSIVMRERVERLIRNNLASSRLNPERICSLAGISRSTLYRLFDDRGGVAAYVQALRLRSVYDDLINPHLSFNSIASLAAGRGLHNAAAFSRAFRRQYGRTPSDARAAALRADSMPSAQSFAGLLSQHSSFG